jgi:hypothetical protein
MTAYPDRTDWPSAVKRPRQFLRDRLNGVGKHLVLALHSLSAGGLAIAR